MSRRFVFVHDAFVRHAINDRDGLDQSRPGSALVGGFDRRFDLFDIGANHRAVGSITRSAGSILTRSFARLGAICHAVVLTWSGKKERDNMQMRPYRVN